MRHIGWRVLIVGSVMLWLAWPAAASSRIALVIGNGNYAHAGKLSNPQSDATEIAAALRRLGFDTVKLEENLDYRALRLALRDFAGQSAGADLALVYFAGHGIEVGGQNYLIPTDARLAAAADADFEAIPLSSVLGAVESARHLRLVILDACRNNPFVSRMVQRGGTRSVGRGLAKVEPEGHTLVAFAAKEGTVALDGEGRHSPFASALLANLEQPGLEIGFLFRRVRDHVLAATGKRQEPFTYGSLGGTPIYLKPGESAPAAVNEKREIELRYWSSIEGSSTPAPFEAYLAKFPDGAFAELARLKLNELEKRLQPKAKARDEPPASPPAPTAHGTDIEIAFWDTIKASDNVAAFESYLEKYPQGSFTSLARLKIEELKNPKPKPKAPQPEATPKKQQKSTSGKAPSTARRGGLCKDGNMAHCQVACRNGFEKACARLRRGF